MSCFDCGGRGCDYCESWPVVRTLRRLAAEEMDPLAIEAEAIHPREPAWMDCALGLCESCNAQDAAAEAFHAAGGAEL